MIVFMTGMTEFGVLLKNARATLGLTQVELAERLDRPHSFVNRMESGKYSNPPDPRDFDALSRELRLPKEAMLRSLGYLDPPSEDEPSDVVTVRRDDPRADLLAMLEGETDEGVRRAADLINAIRMYSRTSINAKHDVPSSGKDDGTTDNNDPPAARSAS